MEYLIHNDRQPKNTRKGHKTKQTNSKIYTWIFQICKNVLPFVYIFLVNFGTNFTHQRNIQVCIYRYISIYTYTLTHSSRFNDEVFDRLPGMQVVCYIYIYIHIFLEPFDDSCFEWSLDLALEGSTTKIEDKQ